MNARSTTSRLLAVVVSLALLTGCATGASPTSAPASSSPAGSPSAAIAIPSPTAAASTAPTPTPPAVVVTSDLVYESANPMLTPDALDVYAPTKAGPSPVVVMFPAGPRSNLSEEAQRVAELGFVVFNASWGNGPGVVADPPTYDSLLTVQSQAACAVEFARAHAAEYGGDPATMIVFGHSAGAHPAAMVTFARPAPTAGCLGRATLGPIDALVTWEGNWLLR
jgi:acetyl esterase/lipase